VDRHLDSTTTNVDTEETPRKEKVDVCYCRVSSSGQKDDLQRQIDYMRRKYPGWEIVSDVGSGLNWKRRGLRALLRRCVQGDIRQVAVAHKDRLARFGYQIIEFMLGECGVQLLCDDAEVHVSKEKELVDDILSIVTVFSARIHGQRHYANDQTRQEAGSRSPKRRRAETQGVDGVLQEDVQRRPGVHSSPGRRPQEDVLLAAQQVRERKQRPVET
jgi:predicted site-specific integrase-resolvase